MWSCDYGLLTESRSAFGWSRMARALTDRWIQLGLVVLAGVGIGLAVIVSTYYVDNVKLLIGLTGGVVFVFLTVRWPEFGILCLVALLSGLISTSWLPVLPLGPVSLNIHDVVLLLLLGLMFVRATTQRGFLLFGSPLLLPLLLFVGAVFLSAANAILIYGVNTNTVLRTVRVLMLWTAFIPTLQLVRDEKALRRLLAGLLVFSVILLIGLLFPNKAAPLVPVEERAMAIGGQSYSGVTRVYFAGDMVLYAMIPVTLASLALLKEGNQLWRIGLLGLLLFWAYRTFFRQYWLTLFVVCILLVGFLSSSERVRLLKRLAPGILAVVLVIAVLMAIKPAQVERVVYVLSERLGSLLRDPIRRESSLKWRIIETRYALRQIGSHPLLGLGLANRYRPPMEGETTFYGDWASRYVENGYLYVAVFMGLVGLVPFLWLCAAHLLRVVLHQHEVRDEGLRATYLGFGAAFLGMVACNLATPTFVFGTRLIFFPVAMAISEVIVRLQREKETLP